MKVTSRRIEQERIGRDVRDPRRAARIVAAGIEPEIVVGSLRVLGTIADKPVATIVEHDVVGETHLQGRPVESMPSPPLSTTVLFTTKRSVSSCLASVWIPAPAFP